MGLALHFAEVLRIRSPNLETRKISRHFSRLVACGMPGKSERHQHPSFPRRRESRQGCFAQFPSFPRRRESRLVEQGKLKELDSRLRGNDRQGRLAEMSILGLSIVMHLIRSCI